MKKRTRFRASIYVDVFIDEEREDGTEKTLEEMREEAEHKVQDASNAIEASDAEVTNPYVGGVAKYTPENLVQPLDRNI